MTASLMILLFCHVAAESTPAPDSALPASYDCEAVVDAMDRLHEQADEPWLKSHCKDSDKFNISDYFTVLKHISVPDAKVLDYNYGGGVSGGKPLLCLRNNVLSHSDMFTIDPNKKNQVIWGDTKEGTARLAKYLKTDGSPESFFELIVFEKLAGMFHLFWHANYADIDVVVSQNQIKKIVSEVNGSDLFMDFFPEKELAALKLDVAPSVSFPDNDTARVSVVVFSKWGGFHRIKFNVARKPPHTIETMDDTVILEYNCGVMY